MAGIFNSMASLAGRRRGLLALALCVAAGSLSGCEKAGPVASEDVAYERVARTNTIRAAYIEYPPAVMRDTKSGKMSGIFVDTLEEAAKNLGWKVEWTEEVGWGSQIEGLTANRYDIVGSPVWANPTRGKLTTLSEPVYYSGIGVYVRSNDNRFVRAANGQWDSINSPNVKIATIDGETGDLIARTQFPKAQRVSLPQNSDISQLFLEVKGNKADVFFAEPYFAMQYFKNNARDVKNIAEANPIKVLGNVYMMRADEFQLKQALDTAIEDLINSGFVDAQLAKYEGGDTFYRDAPPYRDEALTAKCRAEPQVGFTREHA